MVIKTDCRFFKGDIPCKPHKAHRVHCENCQYYVPLKERILIIKLGAIGDVIRTTPLLKKIKRTFPDSHISWLTHYPEVIPREVDTIYGFNLKDILVLLSTSFDILCNLDKEKEVCALANMLKADVKKGFYLEQGNCAPIDDSAKHKWLTGLWDDFSKRNTKSYPEEIFEICDFQFDKERYVLGVDKDRYPEKLKKKDFLIGFNTGCGPRWKTRLWPDEHWVALAKLLTDSFKDVIFLGGPEEDEKNRIMAKASGSNYPGHFSLDEFTSIINQCDLIITGVTMALHLAIGLRKKIVLLNNVFNKNEFELYGLGVILEPEVDCLCCYKTTCEKDCMRLITPEKVAETCERLLEVNDHVKI